MLSSLLFLLLIFPLNHSLPFLCPQILTYDDLNCSIIKGDFRNSSNFTPPPSNPAKLNIVNMNLDRNGGSDSTRMNFLEILKKISEPDFLISNADVLIITELARDCRIYAEYTDGPLEIARSLGLFYGYVVEYVENYQEGDEHQCTMGNAIFSRFPLMNIEQIRFSSQCCKYDIRWGGRIAIVADILVNDQVLTIYSTHLESGQDYFISVIHGFIIRWLQINELIRHSNEKKNNSDFVMIAGDLNAPLGMFDIVNFPLFLDGFQDGHFSMRFMERATCPLGNLKHYGFFIFDYIWVKGGEFEFGNELICNEKYDEKCLGLSDHYPIGVEIYLRMKIKEEFKGEACDKTNEFLDN